MDAELAGQPPAHDRPDDPDDDVPDQAEAAALHQQSGQPAGHDADDDPGDETVSSESEMMHVVVSLSVGANAVVVVRAAPAGAQIRPRRPAARDTRHRVRGVTSEHPEPRAGRLAELRPPRA